MEKEKKKYVIGVDGGGTKTIIALADLKGKILRIARTGPSSPRKMNPKLATKNLALGIKKILQEGNILSTFIGLAAVEEEPRLKTTVKKELLKHKEIFPIFKGELTIDSDQIVAFRAGTDRKDGVLLIAGTGCIARGWKKNKEARTNGWDWLADEGSAFWVGQRVFQTILKDLDGRGPKTKLTKAVFKKLKAANIEELLGKVYSENLAPTLSSFSVLCDEISKRNGGIAKKIMREAGKELALSVITVIKKLEFGKESFPLVLVGGMFNSKTILDIVKRGVKKIAKKAKIVLLKKEPVIGAVKLAIEKVKNENIKTF